MQRPSSVTTFGILNLLFALAGIGGILQTINLLSSSNSVTENPVVELMVKNQAFATWTKYGSVLGLAACIVLLGAGIGLFRFKEWGRKLSIAYGIYGIVSGTVGIAVSLLFLVRPMLESAAQKQGPDSMMLIIIVFSAIIGGIMSLIYPTVLLVFMTRPWMKAAFRSAVPPPLPRG